MPVLLYALLLPAVLVFALHGFSRITPANSHMSNAAAFYARLIISWVAMIIAAGYGVFASIALRVAGYGGMSQWATGRLFKWIMWYTTGVIFVVTEGGRIEGGRRGGMEALNERPAVFVANHQTELDVLMLGTLFPKYCSVTAKKSLKWAPFLGWFMTLSKTVFIDRANRATALAAFDGAARHMQTERQSVWIFPEGTRSYGERPELLPFKKGAFHLAIKAQVPIVPVVVGNYSHVLNVKKRIFRPGTIDVSVLPPIPTKGMTAADADKLTTKTRDAMMSELIRLSTVAPNGHTPAAAIATGVERETQPAQRRVANAL
ncbi:acyltransferase-domain-containing protein [Mytilinidion resinicola]|uniref:1-acyl-sn-glycerol-3-phosphate acyltransferase n=1 Tax=Mytilinidion resinicola TaxID=574789 RepID=A0A6A6Y6G7_9PEZI|nr:acyltransferase-domain-containing protein [Mytilinidion resinicola]KAF2803397.1 acyltransferase-domain-containing protein [Mytilinidion resinicola]